MKLKTGNSVSATEPGVPAVSGSIPLCVPEIRGNEWKYITECLDTNFVSFVGPFVDRFERELAARASRQKNMEERIRMPFVMVDGKGFRKNTPR